MSIGPLGIVAGAAGSALSQTKAAEVERQRNAADRQQQVRADDRAENAAGIGRADGKNHESHDRDADGRLGYQRRPRHGNDESGGEPSAEILATTADDDVLAAPPPAADPSGLSGTQLDLSG